MSGLITGANFFVVLIALLVAFFLIGLLLGIIINRRQNTAKLPDKKSTEDNQDQPPLKDTFGQDDQYNAGFGDTEQRSSPNNNTTRYRNNYW